jgi:hypothetical protein
MKRDSTVGIATGYGFDSRGVRVRFPVGSKSSLLHDVQSDSKVHPVSSPPGVKRPRCEVDHSPPTSAEVKKIWIYTSTQAYAFMA